MLRKKNQFIEMLTTKEAKKKRSEQEEKGKEKQELYEFAPSRKRDPLSAAKRALEDLRSLNIFRIEQLPPSKPLTQEERLREEEAIGDLEKASAILASFDLEQQADVLVDSLKNADITPESKLSILEEAYYNYASSLFELILKGIEPPINLYLSCLFMLEKIAKNDPENLAIRFDNIETFIVAHYLEQRIWLIENEEKRTAAMESFRLTREACQRLKNRNPAEQSSEQKSFQRPKTSLQLLNERLSTTERVHQELCLDGKRKAITHKKDPDRDEKKQKQDTIELAQPALTAPVCETFENPPTTPSSLFSLWCNENFGLDQPAPTAPVNERLVVATTQSSLFKGKEKQSREVHHLEEKNTKLKKGKDG